MSKSIRTLQGRGMPRAEEEKVPLVIRKIKFAASSKPHDSKSDLVGDIMVAIAVSALLYMFAAGNILK